MHLPDLHKAREMMLSFLYPVASNCLCCGHPRLASLEDSLCPACREELSRLLVPAAACERCLSPVSRGKPCAFCKSFAMRDIMAVYAPYRYQGAVRSLIHNFKFNLCDDAAKILAARMNDALKLRSFDCLTPVPMSPKRLNSQGKNHAEVLAQLLSQRTGIPVRLLLNRPKAHNRQSRLHEDQRRRNVENAFVIAEKAEGLRILLIDDVRTTGSTTAACAKVLMEHGAESVYLCTAAVVYRKHPGQKRK